MRRLQAAHDPPDLAWVGSFPSHYIRTFHCRLEERYGSRIQFLYLTTRGEAARAYERGDLPRRSEVVGDGNSIRGVYSLLAKLRASKPDMILVTGHYPRGVLAAGIWGLIRGCRVYYWSDTNLVDVLRKSGTRPIAIRMLLRPYLSRMAGLLYIGSRNKDFYTWVCRTPSRLPPLVWMPLPHCQEPLADSSTSISCAEGKNQEVFQILYLGRLDREKGVDLLIQSMAMLPAGIRQRSRLLVAGDGACRSELEMMVRRLRLEPMTAFLGAIPSDRIAGVLGRCHVLVLPSHRESWGLVINEALSAGKPVVAAHWVGAVGDILIHNVTGLVTESNQPGDLAEAVAKLFNKRDWALRLGVEGRGLIERGEWNLAGALKGLREILSS